MQAPKTVGGLQLTSEKYGLYTYEGGGQKYVVTAQQLATWGKKVTETTIKVHAQKRLSVIGHDKPQ